MRLRGRVRLLDLHNWRRRLLLVDVGEGVHAGVGGLLVVGEPCAGEFILALAAAGVDDLQLGGRVGGFHVPVVGLLLLDGELAVQLRVPLLEQSRGNQLLARRPLALGSSADGAADAPGPDLFPGTIGSQIDGGEETENPAGHVLPAGDTERERK